LQPKNLDIHIIVSQKQDPEKPGKAGRRKKILVPCKCLRGYTCGIEFSTVVSCEKGR
jgi:hypothetical protein